MTEQASRAKVAAVVGFYMVAALIMVFVNKAVLNSSPGLPFSFLFIQMVIAVGLLHLAAAVSHTPTGAQLGLVGKVPLPTLDLETGKKLAPVLIVAIIGFVFNTLCLRDVDASYYQIARGLVLPLTIACAALQSRTAPQLRIILAASIVTSGFFIGVSPSALVSLSPTTPTGSVAILSLVYGFFASLMIAIHSVLVKSAYSYVGNSSIALAYWTNFASGVMLIPFIIFNGEIGGLIRLTFDTAATDELRVFIIGSAVTGVFGFLLCMAGLLSIKVTSPVTHMFSSAARSVIQTVLAVFIFHDTITTNRGLSIFVITLGTIYFTYLKSTGGPKPPAPTPAPATDLEKQDAKS